MEHETFVSLLKSPAHWQFEIFLMVLFDVILGAIIWPKVKPYWEHFREDDTKFHKLFDGKEIVICSAVKFGDKIVRGHRHTDCVYTAHRMGLDTKHTADCEGFITSTNRFVGRKEGYEIQIKAGVKSVLEGTKNDKDVYLGGELFSEDLY